MLVYTATLSAERFWGPSDVLCDLMAHLGLQCELVTFNIRSIVLLNAVVPKPGGTHINGAHKKWECSKTELPIDEILCVLTYIKSISVSSNYAVLECDCCAC
jgi:hypothetical protein